MVRIQDRDDIKKIVKAYIFSDVLYDITDDLMKSGISPEQNDQMVGMFEDDVRFSHFLYYESSKQRIHLFKCFFDRKQSKGPKKGKLNKKQTKKEAERLMKKLTSRRYEENGNFTILINKIDSFAFRPR
jgi:hypothetical protein